MSPRPCRPRSQAQPGSATNDSRELRIEDDLTIYTVLGLKDRLLGELGQCSALDVDLADVSEMDSAGLQLLLLAHREAERAGKTLTLLAPSDAVAQVLKLCNVDARLNVRDMQSGATGA